jgi:hypothetical protein
MICNKKRVTILRKYKTCLKRRLLKNKASIKGEKETRYTCLPSQIKEISFG